MAPPTARYFSTRNNLAMTFGGSPRPLLREPLHFGLCTEKLLQPEVPAEDIFSGS
jgi:hypothetical protein